MRAAKKSMEQRALTGADEIVVNHSGRRPRLHILAEYGKGLRHSLSDARDACGAEHMPHMHCISIKHIVEGRYSSYPDLTRALRQP